jgi:two-component system chemotaxis response regulator CheB
MNEQSNPKFLVVAGASAGGLNAVTELCAQLDSRLDIAVCVVLHVSHISMVEILTQRIQKSTPFTCKIAQDGETLQRHHIYMPPADKHLLIKDNKLVLGPGPAENRWRPSIDILFRSAAVAYSGHTIGIILTGLLQDGIAGMLAIKKSGGVCVVQDPKEAEYPDMPQAIIDNMDVDYCVSLTQMGQLLQEKTARAPTAGANRVPEEVKVEAALSERVATSMNMVALLGDKSVFTCPDCGGGLWEIKEGRQPRYRCHVGHAFTQKELQLRQTETLENTLWIAMRMMEERRQLLEKMADEEQSKGRERSACNKESRALELTMHIDRLKQILFDTNRDENI